MLPHYYPLTFIFSFVLVTTITTLQFEHVKLSTFSFTFITDCVWRGCMWAHNKRITMRHFFRKSSNWVLNLGQKYHWILKAYQSIVSSSKFNYLRQFWKLSHKVRYYSLFQLLVIQFYSWKWLHSSNFIFLRSIN